MDLLKRMKDLYQFDAITSQSLLKVSLNIPY